MESKIRIRIGNIEIEYEGSEEYIKNDLPTLLENVMNYLPAFEEDEFAEEISPESINPENKKVEMTTNTISSKLKVNGGNDLVLAACAHLALVKGADKFKRENILAEMQSASNYYKKSYSNNLSTYLSAQVKAGKLLEKSKDVYSLEAKTLKELEEKLSK